MSAVGNRPIRVAVVYRVCQRWRAPMFARLNAEPDIELTVFHGRGIPGTKLVNSETFEGFSHKQMFTLNGMTRSSGRRVPWTVCPFVGFSLMRYNPDVIVVEGGSNVFTNIFVYAYALLFRKKTVWWTLGVLPGRKFRGIGRLYRAVVHTLERLSTVLLGYSSVALDYFRRRGYPANKCMRAVNCVDTDRVFADIAAGQERVPELRARLGLNGKNVVLFVGALTFEKRIDRLLRAFAETRSKIDNPHLLIVGDGEARASLEELARELNIDADTTFTGRIEGGVADYFQLGSVFVLPGLGGLAISEAMAHGLPLICGQGDGCEVDLVRNGVTGFRTDATSDDEFMPFLKEKLVEILADPDKRAAMGAAARDVIIREHNVHSYIRNVSNAIRAAAGRPLRGDDRVVGQ